MSKGSGACERIELYAITAVYTAQLPLVITANTTWTDGVVQNGLNRSSYTPLTFIIFSRSAERHRRISAIFSFFFHVLSEKKKENKSKRISFSTSLLCLELLFSLSKKKGSDIPILF